MTAHTFSHLVNDVGAPIVPPTVSKTAIKPKEDVLCWPWQHNYAFDGEYTFAKEGSLPTGQLWRCRKCGKCKLTAIKRPQI